jgi:hypothetical protein
LRNAAISPATNSVVTTSSPLYGQNPLLQGLGAGLSTYSLLKDFGDAPIQYNNAPTLGLNSGFGRD